MLWLRSNSSYGELLELDPISGKNRKHSTSALGDEAPSKVNGFFDFLNVTLVAIYVFAGQIILRIGNQTIPIQGSIEVTVEGNSGGRLLSVSQDGKRIASLKYSISDVPSCNNDFTPFTENEDSDFGLFVANIASNNARKDVILEQWST